MIRITVRHVLVEIDLVALVLAIWVAISPHA
jgi:hypothetical protein